MLSGSFLFVCLFVVFFFFKVCFDVFFTFLPLHVAGHALAQHFMGTFQLFSSLFNTGSSDR